MSQLLCYEYCTSGERRGMFNYFGTQKGNRCYCGKLKNIQAPIQVPSKCNTKCKGNHSDEICGGNKEASVYIIKKLPMVPSAAMPATSDFTSATMTATSDLTSAKITTTSVLRPTTITATSVLPPATMKATSVLRFATVTATTYLPSAKITTPLKLPSATVIVTSERGN
ncbi:unnamed protein product [Mytilus edulis]|uniref:WSC domain-containing protein n=1 Tax=Mytilus edulis TaxID=6550 RepID=A0A8S3UA40_MYTED|nr:unnamed protein product [Mytilus edulis]